MKNILALGASSSSKSINKELAQYAASLVEDANVTVLDLVDYEMPLYSIDRQLNDGFPEQAKDFLDHIKASDGVVISFAEHNHSFAAVFKNLIDWLSRIDRKYFQDKPLLFLSTSPGGRGGANVMAQAVRFFPSTGGDIVSSFVLPNFKDNFSPDGIVDEILQSELQIAVQEFSERL